MNSSKSDFSHVTVVCVQLYRMLLSLWPISASLRGTELVMFENENKKIRQRIVT